MLMYYIVMVRKFYCHGTYERADPAIKGGGKLPDPEMCE